MLPFSDPLSSILLASQPEEKLTQTWWLILPNSKTVPGNQGGGIALLSAMHLTRPIGRLLAFLHLSRLIDALDRRFAVWRRWMSDYVPEGIGPRRYP